VREAMTDATAFIDALKQGDTERAVRLYRGPFLDGVHLVALRSWEDWVDGWRTRLKRAFRKGCRELLDAKFAAGDLDGAIAVAEQWTAPDPTDDEAQHRLIAALAMSGERAEAIRQYETYARLLAPEGLEPLDETRALVEQLRSARWSSRADAKRPMLHCGLARERGTTDADVTTRRASIGGLRVTGLLTSPAGRAS
jgi:DNA-binding SARP family transcriptional activator